MSYNIASICKNGHCASSLGDVTDETKFCKQCGQPVICACPDCGTNIRGTLDDAYAMLRPYEVPAYCHNCGSAYPWTKSALAAAEAIIAEDTAISSTLRDQVIEVLPDIVSETPKSSLAAVRLKKVLSSAGKITSDFLRQFIVDFACEYIKRSFGL